MLDWQDGQPFSSRFGDVYFSRDSGLAEKRHVFLRGNHLADRFASMARGESFTVGETGFGTGLSFLCTWQLFEEVAAEGASLDFLSCEKYPLKDSELKNTLARWPELKDYAAGLTERWSRRMPGWNRWSFARGRIRLTLVIDDVAQALPEVRASVNAWFLDGFSPARNPEMWTQQVMNEIAQASSPGTTFATYTCAGNVRRGLEQAGFRVNKSRGFGRKREMLQGYLSDSPPRRPASVPATAIVIGGGVAGCTAARALALRGISVTLLEEKPALAAGASGNPRGILHARLSAGMNPLHRFVLASYGYTLALLDEMLPVDGMVRGQCGELQLAFSPEEAKRIERLAALDWPSHVLRRTDASEASLLAGIDLPHGGLWFPASGWLVPPKLCTALMAHPAITLRTAHPVKLLSRTNAGWRVSGKDGRGRTWTHEAPMAVICTGYQLQSFAPWASLPLTAVRGQITMVPVTSGSENLRTIICASGYFAPASSGLHMLGATHHFDDETTELRASDHVLNLSKLTDISPILNNAINTASQDITRLTGRASVRASVPGAMPLAGELLPGLYTSLGHGTKGLLTAGLSAELIAAHACGQLPPLPQTIIKKLNPSLRKGVVVLESNGQEA